MAGAIASPKGLSGRLTVDLGAIQRNWRALDQVSKGALTGAVVKADAYGTGLAHTGQALSEAGAQFFFVATLDEGIALRAALPGSHIFVLNGLYPGAAAAYVQHRLMPALASMDMLGEWLDECMRHNEALPAALHFDTGMNRLGFTLGEVDEVRRRMDDFGYLPQMVMSHLACADMPNHEKNRTQLALFQAVQAGFPGIPASLANSAGLMAGKEYHYQLVRPGIALYGGRAIGGRPNPMAHAVRLEVPVLQLRHAQTGQSVGYGATQTLGRDSMLAVVAMGYADGFFRALSSTQTRPGGKLAFRGVKAPVVGRISMDLVVVDVTDMGAQAPKPGEMMEVFGPTISVDEQADAAGTIGYEILTSANLGRYKRSYILPKQNGND